MRPARALILWSALALCAVLVLGAMGLLTRNILATKRQQSAAEERAMIEEKTRLALWRMDATGSAILLRENQRPAVPQGGMPDGDAPEVRLRFTLRDGRVLGDEGTAQGETAALVSHLSRNGTLEDLLGEAAEQGELAWQAVPKDNQQLKTQATQSQRNPLPQVRYQQGYQEDSNRIELAQRAKVLESQTLNSAAVNAGPAGGIEDPAIRGIGAMRPAWIGGELFLLRRVRFVADGPGSGTRDLIQGVWLHRKRVEELLLAEVSDLLPAARLVALPSGPADPLALVSLPFRLQRGAAAPPEDASWGAPLVTGWTAVIAALAMAAFLVHGVMRLSERRASFVSAVTHELRTPLTTFRLYSDMLETGVVKPEKRGEYLRVLSREADRLSHLVENVLAFSRIERGNARSNVREAAAGALLEASRERLEARLATAGLSLDMDSRCMAQVRADTTAVEHILFNLIDNAAKYAARSEPPVVTVTAETAGRFVEITVRDHGPGIPPGERDRIFRAFHKSAREAAESQPGVGLGLALSRRLATAQGGTLECTGDGQGACFILRLPLGAPAAGLTP